MKKMINTLFREKATRMILEIYNSKITTYPSTLAKKADLTYSHAIKVLNNLKIDGFLEFEIQGRIKYVKLKKKRKKLCYHLNGIFNGE